MKSVLSGKGITELEGCDLCPEDRESILHVLRECPIAQNFWRMASAPLSLGTPFGLLLLLNAKITCHALDKDYD